MKGKEQEQGKEQDLLGINIPDKNLIEVVLPAAHVPVVVPAVHDIVPLLVVVVPAVLPAVPVVLPVHDFVPLPVVPAVHVPHDSEDMSGNENMSGNDSENMSGGSCSDSRCEDGNVVAENDKNPYFYKKIIIKNPRSFVTLSTLYSSNFVRDAPYTAYAYVLQIFKRLTIL